MTMPGSYLAAMAKRGLPMLPRVVPYRPGTDYTSMGHSASCAVNTASSPPQRFWEDFMDSAGIEPASSVSGLNQIYLAAYLGA